MPCCARATLWFSVVLCRFTHTHIPVTTYQLSSYLQRLDPEDLRGRHKWRKDKEERMKSVLEGEDAAAYLFLY